MIIYVLRHEERYEIPTFYTTLTPEGFKKAEILKNILDKESINLIFSSPFIRVLQTIKPYCEFKDINHTVNIDYSLYETMYDPCFTPDDYKIQLTESDAEFILADPNYKSLIGINDIKCPENVNNVSERVLYFFNYIIEKYKDTNYNILFAAHAATLTPLVINKLNNIYPSGGLLKIYENNKWIYEPINF